MAPSRWLSLLVLPLLMGAATAATEALGPCAPYLQNGTPGAITLVWRQPGDDFKLEVLPVPGEVGRRTRITMTGMSMAGLEQQEIRLANLTPGVRYRWTLHATVSGREWTDTFLLNRGRDAQRAHFAAIGDMGSGDAGQAAIAAQLTAYAPEFVLAAGDIVYPNGAAADYAPKFFTPYQALLGKAVVYPVLGNHDVRTDHGQPYFDAFSLPQEPGNERYYAFDHGPARVYGLDSTQPIGPGTKQYDWLVKDASGSDAPWKIAFFHHPPFSTGLHGGRDDLRRDLAPVFSRLGFDLVVTGHEHHYERFKPQNGVTYVITGGGGAMLYNARGGAQSEAVANTHHFLGLTIAGDWLGLKAIGADGQILDAAAIKRRGSF